MKSACKLACVHPKRPLFRATDGAPWFTSGRGPGARGRWKAKGGSARREMNPLGPAPWRKTNPIPVGAGDVVDRAAKRRRGTNRSPWPLAPGPRPPGFRNEANGALGALGRPCGRVAAIRNEPNGALVRRGKVCGGIGAARNEPKIRGATPKTNPIRGAAPPKRTQYGEGAKGHGRWMMGVGGRSLAARNEATSGPSPCPRPPPHGTNPPTTLVRFARQRPGDAIPAHSSSGRKASDDSQAARWP
jgi:hypothetical protein